jgi:hypothetical protein
LNTFEKEEEMEHDDWQWVARREKGEVTKQGQLSYQSKQR